MPTTKIKKGQAITLSTAETDYELDGSIEPSSLTTVTILLVSGTLSYTVGPTPSEVPIMDATYATYSTAGDKIVVSLRPGLETLRMKCASAGVVNISW
jgi:hypothetical protein